MNPKKDIAFYFDFISPYAYLASLRLHELEAIGYTITLKPVLFAGMLNHHGQKGPAEIAPKRTHTYRQVLWIAKQMGVALQLPHAHPFNPLPMLRLQMANGNTAASMHQLFDYVWRAGHLPSDALPWNQLMQACGRSTPDLEHAAVKQAVRQNTEEAIALTMFGVPCFRIADENFWGLDSLDMLKAYLQGDAFFSTPAWHAAANLPVGASRQ
jgi:2-hydroxychromene-2-carboxylate isomerase